MNVQSLKDFGKNIEVGFVKHRPEILIWIGITGMASAAVMAVRATPKALELIDIQKAETGADKLTATDTVKTTWKCYAPAVVTGVLSASCIVYGNNENLKRNAALAAACKLSETALREYQEKVVATIGEKKEHLIRDDISKDRIEQNPVVNNEVIITGKGTTLCLEVVSGRYFNSDIDRIKKAVNEVNRVMLLEGYISLNEFYYEIGLPGTTIGDTIGWKVDDGFVEVYFSSQLTEDGTPCIVINYERAPNYNFNRF